MSQHVFSKSLFKHGAEDIMPLTFQENMFKGINNDKANIIHNGNVLSVMKGLQIWLLHISRL